MIQSEYIYLLLCMGLVTYLPRWLPLFFLSDRKLSNWFVEWLDLIPAAIPTFIFASFTKSLGGTVVVGMILYWLAGQFM